MMRVPRRGEDGLKSPSSFERPCGSPFLRACTRNSNPRRTRVNSGLDVENARRAPPKGQTSTITPIARESSSRSWPSLGSEIPCRNDSTRRYSDAMVPIRMHETVMVPNPSARRRRRFQRGSLQKRQSGGCWNWIAFWWEAGHRRSQILGPCSTISRPQALAEMATLLQPMNARAGEPVVRLWTVGDWILEIFLPLSRRKWKLSTASTTGDRIRKHLIADRSRFNR
jgi:hypothetical protein